MEKVEIIALNFELAFHTMFLTKPNPFLEATDWPSKTKVESEGGACHIQL